MTNPMPRDFIAQKLAILRDVRKGSRIGCIAELEAFNAQVVAQGYDMDAELFAAIQAKRKILTQGR